MSSAGILNLPITSLPVDNFHDWALWCKSTGINYNMHGWILCRYCATGWLWWISGLRAVTMWSSSSFTKNQSEISRHFSAHPPPKRLRNYNEQAKAISQSPGNDLNIMDLYHNFGGLGVLNLIRWRIPHPRHSNRQQERQGRLHVKLSCLSEHVRR